MNGGADRVVVPVVSSSTQLCLIAGKGGVGKTSISAALAVAAAATGRQVLLVDLERRTTLLDRFEKEELALERITTRLQPKFRRVDQVAKETLPTGTGSDEFEVAPGIAFRSLAPDVAFLEWLNDHGLRALAGRLAKTGALDVIATATPGIRELLVLAKIKQIANLDPHRLVIVDAPASGHAVSLLTSPAGIRDAVRGGPIRNQAEQVLAMLNDHDRTTVCLVTVPEETPVNELFETIEELRQRTNVGIGNVIVNQVPRPLSSTKADRTGAAGSATPGPINDALEFLELRQRYSDTQIQRVIGAGIQPVLTPLITSPVFGRKATTEVAEALRPMIEQG